MARSTIQDVLCKCIRCNRVESNDTSYLINQLPVSRIQIQAHFFSTSVDYIKEWTRSKTITKICLCVFVCLAVHLEVTRDLITESFLTCLNRFLACRGRYWETCSDNGTNFPLSAWNESSRISQKEFIPLQAPHFDGLWGGAVKSAKRHLLRMIGETRLTYEELCTVLAWVEACLNSLLYPISSDPKDFDPLMDTFGLDISSLSIN